MAQLPKLPPLRADDPLGRENLSKRRHKKAIRHGRVDFSLVQASEDRDLLSVDRLDLAPDSEIVEIADRNGRLRGKSFLGWAVVSVQDASNMGRQVLETPTLDNHYHADICLNLPAEQSNRVDWIMQHAFDLASSAVYRERP